MVEGWPKTVGGRPRAEGWPNEEGACADRFVGFPNVGALAKEFVGGLA